MATTGWRLYAGFWRAVASQVPTRLLQDALDGRPGIDVHRVGVEGRWLPESSARGPAIVTINRG